MVNDNIVFLRVVCNVALTFLVWYFSKDFWLGVYTCLALSIFLVVQLVIAERRAAKRGLLMEDGMSLADDPNLYGNAFSSSNGMAVASGAMLASQNFAGSETDLNAFSSIDAMGSADHEIMTDPFFTTDFSGHSDMIGMNSFTSDSSSMDMGLSSSSIDSCSSGFHTGI